MKKASIVSIGNELLNGQAVDTNSAYLSSQLLSLGIPTTTSYTVPDDNKAIARAFTLACQEADLVLVTGGLGPTDDDVTRQAFAEFLGTELKLDHNLLQQIEQFFKRRNLQMLPKNKVQAFIPIKAKPISNKLGTAPGIMAQKNGKWLFALPGVPAEMKQMFELTVLTEIKKNIPDTEREAIAIRKLKCFGTGESNIAELLGPIMQRNRNPLVNCTVKYGTITLQIIATADNKEQAQKLAQKDEELIRNKLNDFIFGIGEETLSEIVGRMLIKKQKTLSVAESCTGGLVSKLITDTPGASSYFKQSWVTYCNEAKIEQLGVPKELIEKHGAVSQQVVEAMAKSARQNAKTDYAIAITGIAGPTGATEKKTLGLVYITVDSDKKCQTKHFVFSHDREFVRFRAAQTALNMLRQRLLI